MSAWCDFGQKRKLTKVGLTVDPLSPAHPVGHDPPLHRDQVAGTVRAMGAEFRIASQDLGARRVSLVKRQHAE